MADECCSYNNTCSLRFFKKSENCPCRVCLIKSMCNIPCKEYCSYVHEELNVNREESKTFMEISNEK